MSDRDQCPISSDEVKETLDCFFQLCREREIFLPPYIVRLVLKEETAQLVAELFETVQKRVQHRLEMEIFSEAGGDKKPAEEDLQSGIQQEAPPTSHPGFGPGYNPGSTAWRSSPSVVAVS